MEQAVMAQICETLNNLGGMTPAIACPELFDVLSALFTEEEAKVAARMPPVAQSAEDLAAHMEISVESLQPLLESMADKGIILTRDKDRRHPLPHDAADARHFRVPIHARRGHPPLPQAGQALQKIP